MPSDRILSIFPLPVGVKTHTYVNSYKLERIDSQVLMQFCFVHGNGGALNRYASMISERHLQNVSAGLTEYVEKTEFSGESVEISLPMYQIGEKIDSVAYIQVSAMDEIAEIGMVSYTMQHYVHALENRGFMSNPLVQKILESDTQSEGLLKTLETNGIILADTIAILRCTPKMQKRFILDLLETQK